MDGKLLTTREIAIAVWSAIAFGFALSKPRIRKSLKSVLGAFFERKILVTTALMIIYVIAMVLALHSLNIWTIAELKETIIWFVFGAVPLAFSTFASRSQDSIFSEILADSLRLIVLVEFLVTSYTFSLPVELVFVPLMTIVMMLHGVASSDRRYSSVASLFNGIQAAIGLAVFVYVISRAIAEFQSLLTIESAREILLAPVLSILFGPYIYFMLVLISYESILNLLRIDSNKDRKLKGYAQRRLFAHLRISLSRIRDFHQAHGLELTIIQTRVDVDKLLEPSEN